MKSRRRCAIKRRQDSRAGFLPRQSARQPTHPIDLRLDPRRSARARFRARRAHQRHGNRLFDPGRRSRPRRRRQQQPVLGGFRQGAEAAGARSRRAVPASGERRFSTRPAGLQSPELSISMVPEYYLNQSETDQSVWARMRANPDAASLRAFLARYPGSFYAPDAAARLDLIESQTRKEADADKAEAAARTASEDGREAEGEAGRSRQDRAIGKESRAGIRSATGRRRSGKGAAGRGTREVRTGASPAEEQARRQASGWGAGARRARNRAARRDRTASGGRRRKGAPAAESAGRGSRARGRQNRRRARRTRPTKNAEDAKAGADDEKVQALQTSHRGTGSPGGRSARRNRARGPAGGRRVARLRKRRSSRSRSQTRPPRAHGDGRGAAAGDGDAAANPRPIATARLLSPAATSTGNRRP